MYTKNPPLPTPKNFPFQFARGNHTSNPISESATGRITPATRQNAGRSAGATMGMPPRGPADQDPPIYGFGRVNAPAATRSAKTIVVSGNFRARRFSHDWGAIAVESADAVTGTVAEAAASVPVTTRRTIDDWSFIRPDPTRTRVCA